MVKKKLIFAIITIILIGSLFACGTNSDNEENDTNQEETSSKQAEKEQNNSENWFANLKTTDINGNEVTSDLFAEKELTLINVWATFCNPCISEIPELEKLYQEGEIGVVGLLVDTTSEKLIEGLTEEEKELGLEIIELTKATYPQILVSKEMLETDFINLRAFPTTYIVDKNGNFVGKKLEGAKDKENWLEVIKERMNLLEEMGK